MRIAKSSEEMQKHQKFYILFLIANIFTIIMFGAYMSITSNLTEMYVFLKSPMLFCMLGVALTLSQAVSALWGTSPRRLLNVSISYFSFVAWSIFIGEYNAILDIFSTKYLFIERIVIALYFMMIYIVLPSFSIRAMFKYFSPTITEHGGVYNLNLYTIIYAAVTMSSLAVTHIAEGTIGGKVVSSYFLFWLVVIYLGMIIAQKARARMVKINYIEAFKAVSYDIGVSGLSEEGFGEHYDEIHEEMKKGNYIPKTNEVEDDNISST